MPKNPHANQRIQTVAALFVSGRSIYRHMPNVRAYGLREDAMTFNGNVPVVAHPPCRTWSRTLRHQAKPNSLVYEQSLGLWAAQVVMANGGVLEQPAHSLLWAAAKLPMPSRPADAFCYTIVVEQRWWGYRSRKATWLLICGVPRHYLPPMPFSLVAEESDCLGLSQCGRSRTMPAFAAWLCQIARCSWWVHR